MAGSPSSGALSPMHAAQDTLQTGIHHLSESLELVLLKNIYGGLLLSSGGLLALTLATGIPSLSDSNPGLMRLAQGASFPVGLVLVYFVGAELYTGYPMWFAMTALARRGRPLDYISRVLVSWLGNLVGALFFSAVFSYSTEALTEEPFRSGVVKQVTEDIIERQWHVIFLRSIGCGFLVTLAMFVGTQNRDGISKALGLHLPFFVSTVAKFPHTVEYMYLGSIGMMLGAKMSVGAFLWKCMLPVTLGNTVGGMFFTGSYFWWIYLHRADDQEGKVQLGWQYGDVDGEEDGQ